MPAERRKQRRQLARFGVGHDAVEALAVDVDDPEHVVESGDEIFAERLPHVAFVQLGVADHHDEALGTSRLAGLTGGASGEIAPTERAERRRHRA